MQHVRSHKSFSAVKRRHNCARVKPLGLRFSRCYVSYERMLRPHVRRYKRNNEVVTDLASAERVSLQDSVNTQLLSSVSDLRKVRRRLQSQFHAMRVAPRIIPLVSFASLKFAPEIRAGNARARTHRRCALPARVGII